MKGFTFLEKLRFIVSGHLLAPIWWSRFRRRAWRSHIIYKIIEKHCLPYLSVVENLEEQEVIQDDENEKIYSLWAWNKKPELVDACFRSMKRHCKQDLIVLDEKTLFDYMDLPDFIMDKRSQGKIGNAHFSDIARVELLFNHGGFWMDSTLFVTAKIPQDIVDQDLFMYLWKKPSDFSYGFIQNCFIRARKGSYLMQAWRAVIHEYWKNEDTAMDYFIHQILFKILVKNDPRAEKYFNEMLHIDQGPTHGLWPHHKDEFVKELFDELTSKVFFQKTRYADTAEIIDGSFADVIIKV